MPAAEERHARFNPGPPTRARGWYGHFRVGVPRRRLALRQRIDAAWDAAKAEDWDREVIRAAEERAKGAQGATANQDTGATGPQEGATQR